MIDVVHRLSLEEQQRVLEDVRQVVKVAPLFPKFMPKTGYRFNYACTSAGEYGWYSDKEKGFRYEDKHPVLKEKFPDIPQSIQDVIEVARQLAGEPDFKAHSCLINVYGPKSTLGIHQDNTEKTLKPMVVSVSLGADMDFEWCHKSKGRQGKKEVVRIKSGDVLVFGGEHRLCWHGVPNPPILGTAPAALKIQDGFRINLTIRQVDP